MFGDHSFFHAATVASVEIQHEAVAGVGVLSFITMVIVVTLNIGVKV